MSFQDRSFLGSSPFLALQVTISLNLAQLSPWGPHPEPLPVRLHPHGLGELGSKGFICSFHASDFSGLQPGFNRGGGLAARTSWGSNHPLWLPSVLVNLETPAPRDHQSQRRHPFCHQQPISCSSSSNASGIWGCPLFPSLSSIATCLSDTHGTASSTLTGCALLL